MDTMTPQGKCLYDFSVSHCLMTHTRCTPIFALRYLVSQPLDLSVCPCLFSMCSHNKRPAFDSPRMSDYNSDYDTSMAAKKHRASKVHDSALGTLASTFESMNDRMALYQQKLNHHQQRAAEVEKASILVYLYPYLLFCLGSNCASCFWKPIPMYCSRVLTGVTIISHTIAGHSTAAKRNGLLEEGFYHG